METRPCGRCSYSSCLEAWPPPVPGLPGPAAVDSISGPVAAGGLDSVSGGVPELPGGLATDGLPPDPDDANCATGCSVASDGSPELSADEFEHQLRRFGRAPLVPELSGAGVEALETLLFHGEHARTLVDRLGTWALSPEHDALLRAELARTHVLLEVRMVADDGTERLRLEPRRVPLGIKAARRTRTHRGPAATGAERHRAPSGEGPPVDPLVNGGHPRRGWAVVHGHTQRGRMANPGHPLGSATADTTKRCASS